MGLIGASWCFCDGGAKSERIKATVFSTKSAAMACLSSSAGDGGEVTGSGFLIHKNLLLTTHVNLPSATAAESIEIRLQNGVAATLVPSRFFITSSVLDLTIVGIDSMEGGSCSPGPQPHSLKTFSNPNLELGSDVYVLGYSGNKELEIGEGKVVIATDNLIKLSTDGVAWSPGSAGFDTHGNLAFLICDPMKLATSPYTKSSASTPSSSSKQDRETLFGIPMPVICGWLNQHWEGFVEEQSKPKPSLMRLMSADKKRENHRASSLITNEVFDASEEAEDLTDSSSPKVITEKCSSADKESKAVSTDLCAANPMEKEEADPRVSEASIPPQPSMDQVMGLKEQEVDREENEEGSSSGSTNGVEVKFAGSEERVGKPEMETENSAETAKSRSNTTPREARLEKKEISGIPLSDINFDQSAPESSIPPQPSMDQIVDAEEQKVDSREGNEEVSSSGSANEVDSSPSDVAGSKERDEKLEKETANSVETAESRSNTPPREASFQESVGVGQNRVKYNQLVLDKYPMARKSSVEKNSSLTEPGKSSSPRTSHRSNDYCSPTVSSIIKKINANSEKPKPAIKTRQTGVSSAPRWAI